MRYQSSFRERCELHEPHSVGVGSNQLTSYLQSQTSLATPTRPGQSQQPRHGQISLEFAQLTLSADEAAPRGGQVMPADARGFFERDPSIFLPLKELI